MTLVSGYLGLLTTLAATDGTSITTSAVEFAGPGYARQPVSFSSARDGVSKLASFYSFGFLGGGGQVVGRALYTSPTGSDMVLHMPFGNGARLLPGAGPSDSLDVGGITLFLSAMAAFEDGDAYSGIIVNASGTAVGTVYDATDEGMALWSSVTNRDGTVSKAIKTGTLIMPAGGAINALGGRLLPIVPLVQAGF